MPSFIVVDLASSFVQCASWTSSLWLPSCLRIGLETRAFLTMSSASSQTSDDLNEWSSCRGSQSKLALFQQPLKDLGTSFLGQYWRKSRRLFLSPIPVSNHCVTFSPKGLTLCIPRSLSVPGVHPGEPALVCQRPLEGAYMQRLHFGEPGWPIPRVSSSVNSKLIFSPSPEY